MTRVTGTRGVTFILDRLLWLSLSILLIALSFPGRPLPLLVCLTLAPVMIASINLSAFKGAALYFIWALLWWLGAIWWLAPALSRFAQVPMISSALLLILTCGVLALPYGIAGFLTRYYQWWNKPFNLIKIPLAFTVCTSLTPSLIPASPVNALYNFPILIQFADIGGVPLLVFLYAAFNVACVNVYRHFSFNENHATPKISNSRLFYKHIRVVFPVLLIPSLVLSYGWFRLPGPTPKIPTDSNTISIGYIQPNATVNDKLSTLILQSKKLLQLPSPSPSTLQRENIDLIIWPEVPTSFSWADNNYDRYRIKRYINEVNSHLIMVSGYRYANSKNASDGFYNTAHFISPEGIQLSQYDKQHLVPFFEYLPFTNTAPWIKKWFPGSKNYLSGTHPETFDFNNNLQLAPLICYEILFSDLFRDYKNLGATIIINPSNDGWFGAQGALSHLSIAMFRTIEYHMPLVRVGNTGISTIINAHGEISENDTIPINKISGNVVNVSASHNATIYSLFGKWIHHITTLLFLLLLVIDRPRDRT